MPFGAESTTDEVLEGVDLKGKRFLVTGASAGLGVETVRALRSHGAEVVGAVRDLAKGKRALTEAGVGDTPLVELDLASLASVRKCADGLNADGRKFDVLIGNAGVMCCPEGRTTDGFETQLGSNHLGHFVFFNRLAPLVKDNGRVIVLSSAAHRICDVNLEDPTFATSAYEPWQAYGRSKTANALYALALDKRLKARGIRAASVHPGGIQTELGRHLTPELIQAMMARRSGGMKFKSIPQGAATTVWAAAKAPADAIGGNYCADCQVAKLDDGADMNGVRSWARDADRAEALWAKSEAWVGERFAL